MDPQSIHTREVVVMLQNGLHLSPAAQIVKTAQAYQSSLIIQKGDRRIDGKSMFDLMTLAAEQGSRLRLEAQGADAETLLTAVVALFEANFALGSPSDSQASG
jgi:phosphotransferase system HPr (HPr) family protein